MKKLPLNLSNFSRMIKEGYIYVDHNSFQGTIFNLGQACIQRATFFS